MSPITYTESRSNAFLASNAREQTSRVVADTRANLARDEFARTLDSVLDSCHGALAFVANNARGVLIAGAVGAAVGMLLSIL